MISPFANFSPLPINALCWVDLALDRPECSLQTKGAFGSRLTTFFPQTLKEALCKPMDGSDSPRSKGRKNRRMEFAAALQRGSKR